MSGGAVRFHWKGTKRPTRAELRALSNRARSLRAGDYDAKPANVRQAAPAAERAYSEFHWGNQPRKIIRTKLPSYERGLYALGKLRAVEYETNKGGESAIWVHDFTRPYPTITATPGGKLGPIIGGAAFVTDRGIEK